MINRTAIISDKAFNSGNFQFAFYSEADHMGDRIERHYTRSQFKPVKEGEPSKSLFKVAALDAIYSGKLNLQ